MLNLNEVIIVSERLIQVPISEKYIKDIFDNFTSEITTYMYPQPSGDIKDVEAFVRSSMEGLSNGSNLQLVILDLKTDEFLGCSGLHHANERTPELGIWLKKTAHNNAYGLEAIHAIIEWAKENVEFDYIKYPVDENNHPSRRIPEKHAGIQSKTYKHKNMIGKELDIVEYWIYKS